jgi:adenine-specific DNA methylase
MIPKECKRLAEVDFPIAVVSKHAAREKSIRHGHPSTLHLWWARRPLAACRAMLMALLLPDPADSNCPGQFLEEARRVLAGFPGATPKWAELSKTGEGLREILLKFIGDFANWDVASDLNYLKTARALVRAAHGDEPPLVVDPFAGGGSIPLEALRIGCDAFASDLNPVACLILKTMLEDIPRHGPGLADELRKAGAEIKAAAEKELRQFYPPDPDGATPIAYLWARTITCETPNCGAEIPLIRSFWLSKKANRRRAMRWRVRRPKGQPPQIDLEVFAPASDKEVPIGTVSRAKAKCPSCEVVLPPERVRAQLYAQHGGADAVFNGRGERTGGARMLAVVVLHENRTGRQYRIPTSLDYRAVWKAQKKVHELTAERLPDGAASIPDEPLPPVGTLGFRVQRYGMLQWGDLFTARQKLALSTFSTLIQARSDTLPSLLALVRLLPVGERAGQLFGDEGADAVAGSIETAARRGVTMSFDFMAERPEPTIPVRGRKGRRPRAAVDDAALDARQAATTLDRVHAAMLLQGAGRATALRTFLKAEQERGPEFLRLANALSALYPKDSEEKRLLDAMLLAVPR